MSFNIQRFKASGQVFLFWDLENCNIPVGVTVTEAVIRIRQVLSRYGSLSKFCFRIYANANLLASISDEEAELNDVTKVPVLVSGKDSADKVIIADIWQLMWDHLFAFYQTNDPSPDLAIDKNNLTKYSPPTIALISTDVDFFDSLRRLKERGFTTIVIHSASVHPSVTDCSAEHIDWYKLVRGIPFGRPRRAINIEDSILKLEKCLEKMVLIDKLQITEKNVRASMKYDGKHNDEGWLKLSSEPRFKQLFNDAMEQQKSLISYNPSAATWESFSLVRLQQLYQLLLWNSGLKKNGKYPMALNIHSQLNQPNCPLAQVLEFIELACGVNWIIKEGSSYSIRHGLLQQLPLDDILPKTELIHPVTRSTSGQSSCRSSSLDSAIHPVHNPSTTLVDYSHNAVYNPSTRVVDYSHVPGYNPGYNPSTTFVDCSQLREDRKIIPEVNGKAALQYYFQVNLKSLPRYECRRSGEDHKPIFEVTVLVSYKGNSFFAYGSAGLKKQAEKCAAKNACDLLIKQGYHLFPAEFFQQ